MTKCFCFIFSYKNQATVHSVHSESMGAVIMKDKRVGFLLTEGTTKNPLFIILSDLVAESKGMPFCKQMRDTSFNTDRSKCLLLGDPSV